jgi:predicted protein tyrosine phosphatase
MTSITQRDHDELIQLLTKQREEVHSSREAARKFLVEMGFGNYCDESDGEIVDAESFVVCDCDFCDNARKKHYNAALRNSRLARICGIV